MRRTHVAALPLLVLAACGGSGGGGGGSGDVTMVQGQQFEPAAITVSAGETITFVSDSPEPHTVTAYEESLPEGAGFFSSGGAPSEEEARSELGEALIKDGGTFEITLETPGTYRYFCIPHESQGMKGTITVTE